MKQCKPFLSALLALGMALALAVPAFADYDAPPDRNDHLETADDHSSYDAATEIEDDGTYSCILLSDSEEDWYKIVFDQSGSANFWIHCTRPNDANLSLQLYLLSDGKLVRQGTASYTGDQPNQQAYFMDVEVGSGMTYYIKVAGDIGSMSAYYILRARRLPAPTPAEPTGPALALPQAA